MMVPKNQIRLLILSNMLCWALLLVFLLSGFVNGDEGKVLNVERINIVNEDGTTVLAIANKQRIAAPRMDGKEYPVGMIEREHVAGMILFNEQGDEMGGLVFNSNELPDGRKYGTGHLSFDRYRDNQVINLEHTENIRGAVKSGLTIYDRSGNGSFGKNLDLIHEFKYDDVSDDRKKEIIREINELKKNGDLGQERLFLGSDNEVPQLTLKDESGTERLRLFIDSANEARIHFFDEDGELTHQFPESR